MCVFRHDQGLVNAIDLRGSCLVKVINLLRIFLLYLCVYCLC